MTRLAGLMLAVMLLSNVLARTEDLQQISVSLFGGKPLARYLSLAFGTSLVSVPPLNFGSVAVVGSLVGERIRRNGDSESTAMPPGLFCEGLVSPPPCFRPPCPFRWC